VADAFLVGLALLVGCGTPAEPVGFAQAAEVQAVGEFLNHDLDVRYVGREACRPCHEGNAACFSDTGMGRSFYPLTADRIEEDFTENNEFFDEATGLHYRMFEREGRFYQRQFLLDSRGREMAVDERELVYVIGSNNHGRAYVTVHDGKLFQAPICWDPTNRFWMFCPGFELTNSNFSREISYTCISCHNGKVELLEGERNLYREPLPHGVGCERCHGPGELHVARHEREQWEFLDGDDPTIVNPARLPREERIHVCFQCHLGDFSGTELVFRYGRSHTNFRPGQRITEVVIPFRFVQRGQYDFGIASQADRLILSRCYTESDGKLECLTCHNPHITVYDNPAGSFRNNCRICHEPDACAAPPETRRQTAYPDDCVECHMRKAESSDRRHALFTDHWIRRDIDLEQRDLRTNFDLEPIFPEIFATFPEGEQAFYLARANFLRAKSAAPGARQLLWDRAQRAFEEAISKGFDTPDAWFFLGSIHIYRGRRTEAIEAMRQARRLDPGHHDAAYALGQSLVALGRSEEALEVFREMLQRDPDDAMALAELGRSQWSLKRPEEAIRSLRRAIEQEPWQVTLRLNLARMLAARGRMNDAVEEGLRASRLDPDSVDVWEFLSRATHSAGRRDDELEARRQLAYLKQHGR
jgi:tetratricopeptide (TPR) repeat protein